MRTYMSKQKDKMKRAQCLLLHRSITIAMYKRQVHQQTHKTATTHGHMHKLGINCLVLHQARLRCLVMVQPRLRI